MKTIFDLATREELIRRINLLNENSQAQWGKMNVYQMIKHCEMWEEMAMGRKTYKRSFIGRLIGPLILKKVLKDETPLQRNTPTIPEFKITGNGNVETEKAKWIALLGEYDHFSNHNFIHPFFGKMTKEQIGLQAYKHIDHHLRQFNC